MSAAFSTLRPERLIPVLQRIMSGTLTIKSEDIALIVMSTFQKEYVIDIRDLERLKEMLNPLKASGLLGEGGGERQSLMKRLGMMKGFAAKLAKEGTTISIRREGESVLVMGERASPGLTKILLGNNIQANILKIVSMIRALR